MPVKVRVRKVREMPEKRTWVPTQMQRIVSQLKRSPGEQFEIRRYTGTQAQKQGGYVYAHNCKTGKIRSLSPAAGFTVTAIADRSTNSVVVYATYIGKVE